MLPGNNLERDQKRSQIYKQKLQDLEAFRNFKFGAQVDKISNFSNNYTLYQNKPSRNSLPNNQSHIDPNLFRSPKQT